MSSATPRPPIAIAIVPAAMLLIALAPLPYGYYQLLRLVVAAAGIWLAYSFWSERKVTPAIVVGIAVLVFNPLIPVHFDRQTWAVLNVVAAAIFSTAAWLILRSARTKADQR